MTQLVGRIEAGKSRALTGRFRFPCFQLLAWWAVIA